MQPRHILAITRKWLWLIILACLIGGAAGLAVARLQPKKYEADATIFISSTNRSDYNTLLGDEEAAKAFAVFPQSNAVLAAVIKDVGDQHLTVPQLATMVSVDNTISSQFVTIRVRDSDPKQAAVLASDIAKQSITQFEGTITDNSTIQFLHDQIANLSAQINKQQQQLIALQSQIGNGSPTPDQTNSIDQLIASINGLRVLYNQDVTVYSNLTSIQASLLQEPQVPTTPTGPSPVLAIGIGALAALIAIIGIIILIEQTDDVLRTPEKVEKASGLSTLLTVRRLPALAQRGLLLNGHVAPAQDTSRRQQLPVITNGYREAAANQAPWLANQHELIDDTDKRRAVMVRSAASTATMAGFKVKEKVIHEFQLPEGFLTLGALLRGERSQLTTKGGTTRSLLISSPENHDGKTLIAAQIAIGLARVGMQVVLVDANLRKPEVHKIFGVSNRVGLSSLLTSEPDTMVLPGNQSESRDEQGTWDALNHYLADYTFDTVQETHEPNLSILTAGPPVDSSPEILSSPAMNTIIDLLSEKAFVVLDGPAVLTSSEAVILANKSNSMLMVVNARHTTATRLNRSLAMLAWVKTDVLGVVLNQVGRRT